MISSKRIHFSSAVLASHGFTEDTKQICATGMTLARFHADLAPRFVETNPNQVIDLVGTYRFKDSDQLVNVSG